MSRVVFKYPLSPLAGPTEVPRGRPVMVGDQGGPTVWVEHSSESPDHSNPDHYYIFGTGHSIPDEGLEHVGSCFSGPFVWHVYRQT